MSNEDTTILSMLPANCRGELFDEHDGSSDYDIRINCKCGNTFYLYVDAYYRCDKCGRIYTPITLVMCYAEVKRAPE